MAPDPYRYFRIEARELLEQLGQGALDLEKEAPSAELIARLLRLAHTLKGAAGAVRQKVIAEHAHTLEDIVSALKDTTRGAPKETVNAVLALLDQIGIRVGALGTPEPTPTQDAQIEQRPSDEPVHAFRPEADDLKNLVDGIAEVESQLGLLRPALGRADRVGQLIDLLDNQLAALRTVDGADRVGIQRIRSVVTELQQQFATVAREFSSGVDLASREMRQVGEAAARLRLVPASGIFRFLERAVRDAAEALGKQASFQGMGAEVRVDSGILTIIQSALLHVVRNSVAHGIEPRADRVVAGKPAAGRVTVTVARRGPWISFSCADDGRGIDLDAIRKAVRRREGAGSTRALLDDDALLRLVLEGGISTATTLTGIAGRGIGMDVVREAAQRLAGEVTLRTDVGKGTTVELLVPSAIASFQALLVEVGGTTALIPLESVRGAMRSNAVGTITTGADGQTMLYRDRAIPYTSLHGILDPGGQRRQPAAGASAFVVEADGESAAFAVDRVIGAATVVTQPLPAMAFTLPVVVGASLDADGRPRLALDPARLVGEARRATPARAIAATIRHSILVIDDSLTTRMLEQSILESAGYDVTLASSAEEGLETARGGEFALILVDVEMPGMDGFTFIEQIRMDPILRAIPAILVTSRSSAEDLDRGRSVGAQGYIVKGEFDQRALLERIAELVGR